MFGVLVNKAGILLTSKEIKSTGKSILKKRTLAEAKLRSTSSFFKINITA